MDILLKSLPKIKLYIVHLCEKPDIYISISTLCVGQPFAIVLTMTLNPHLYNYVDDSMHFK